MSAWTTPDPVLDEIVEVAPEQRALPAGAVVRFHLHAVVDQRDREQAAFEPRVLRLAYERLVQLSRLLFRSAALDCVSNGAGQQLSIDQPLDQVVLSTGGDGFDAAVLVAQPGEHENRGGGEQLQRPGQGIHAEGIGQAQVEEHAIRLAADCRGFAQTPRFDDVGAQVVLEEFADEERVTGVVLDKQKAQAAAGASGVSLTRERCRRR